MDIFYDKGKITQTIADLRMQLESLRTQDEAIKGASAKLAGVWESGAASTFQEVQKRWNDEFTDTQAAMQQLINATQEALDAALRTDAFNASKIQC
ncbi:WXG100 family type VII secretion target [Nocardia sp. NPDC057353]|uniref:WXG100 family type VII secretion target n=1 Tax=Nocardia sp. NPDC057353 TaxID=3346104 RepID=UPI003624E0B6